MKFNLRRIFGITMLSYPRSGAQETYSTSILITHDRNRAIKEAIVLDTLQFEARRAGMGFMIECISKTGKIPHALSMDISKPLSFEAMKTHMWDLEKKIQNIQLENISIYGLGADSNHVSLKFPKAPIVNPFLSAA